MSLELNEEIDIKSETIEEHDFMSVSDIKIETFEEEDNAFESNVTFGNGITLSCNETDIKIEVDPVEIGGELATVLKNPAFGKRLACEICRKQFKTKKHLCKHLKYRHRIANVKPYVEALIQCFVCNKNFAEQSMYKVHLLSHADVLHSLFNSEKNDSCKYTCKICGRVQTSKTNNVHHIKTVHLRLRDFECKICGRYFITKSGFNVHSILKHSKFKPMSCVVCFSKFRERSKLQYHLLAQHRAGENLANRLLKAQSACKKSFTCKVCNIKFEFQHDFHQHFSDVHAELYQIKCPVCHKDFTCIVTLIDHLQAHGVTHLVNFNNKSPDGNYVNSIYECDTCKKVFTTTELLKRHNASNHTSSLTCSSCKDSFSSVRNLNIHLANVDKNTFEMSQSSSSHNSVKCKICKQNFDKPSIKNHFRKIHKINKKQKSQQQNRREHQKVSQRKHRTAEYLKNRLGSSPVKPQLQQALKGRKLRPDCNSTGNSWAEDWITKVKPCCVLLDRGEVTRYLARLDKREEGTVGSSPIEDLPPPLATPPVRVYPSHPCGRVGVTSDHLLSAATSNVGLVCNNIGPRTVVEPKQLCVVNSGDGEVSSNNCNKSENLALQKLENFVEMYLKSEPFFLL